MEWIAHPLTDMFNNADVNNENTIDSELQFGLNLQSAEVFFSNKVGMSLEEIIYQYKKTIRNIL